MGRESLAGPGSRDVEAIRAAAKRLGWRDRSLARVFEGLEEDESIGEITEGYIEILGGRYQEFFLNHEAAEQEAREIVSQISSSSSLLSVGGGTTGRWASRLRTTSF